MSVLLARRCTVFPAHSMALPHPPGLLHRHGRRGPVGSTWVAKEDNLVPGVRALRVKQMFSSLGLHPLFH